ncbi:conserved membrane hypothetical protein [Desulfamplus magnetovallimortis]|uniref:Permease n=1 Tax=Desulfamplus magnetovallimortis TaxID=1246637 RepID=A0A1W1H7G0_9BACT|nr:AI-2E family transporter [Desulfamplus magnetovallimortis]SLM28393.1 conserved membrane hypothetical protein [Desulfamplus magnetovallimortis]
MKVEIREVILDSSNNMDTNSNQDEAIKSDISENQCKIDISGISDTVPKLNIAHYFLFILISAAFLMCYKMMQGYLDPVIIAIILAVLSNPVYQWIKVRCNHHKNVAALISCLLLNMVIIIPFFLLFSAVIRQGILSFNAINQWIADGNIERVAQTPLISHAFNFIHNNMQESLLKEINVHSLMITLSSRAGEIMMSQGKYIITNISAVAGKFCLMIFVFFFVIQDQDKKLEYIMHLSPLSSEHERILLDKIKAVAKSAILGTLVTALSQGTAGGIAFYICGLPGFFWGAVMAFASLVPMVGTALIWVPATIWLFISGSWQYAVFLTVWSVVVVGMIDNIVRPLFMKGSAGMDTLLIFFSILGGLSYFGLTGLLYGPMVFGLTLVLLYIYELEFNAFLTRQDGN